MIQEDLDEDVYHYDFTTASEWEIFIARLEEIIHEWKLNVDRGNLAKPLKPRQLFDGNWTTKSENISFADVDFTLTRHYLTTEENDNESEHLLDRDDENFKLQALEDMMCLQNDFIPIVANENGSHPHVLARWYSLRDFIVLAPVRSYNVTSESKIKILLSSICIAINNSNCEVPIFIQALEPWQNFFMGLCEGRGIRAEFEMVHLKRVPPHCRHLSGLLDLFKTRLGVMVGLPLNPIRVSVKLTYTLRDWTYFVWTQEPPDFDFLQGEVGVAELGTLPFGATFEPVSELILYTVWPDELETGLLENESFCDLDPDLAPKWIVSIKMAEKPVCLLSEYMSEFLQLCSSQRTMHELLGELVQQDLGSDLLSPLSILTDSKVPSISKVLGQNITSKRKDKVVEGPIPNDHLMPILYFLFPDADNTHNQPRSPYPETIGNTISREPNTAESFVGNGLKSAPVDGLVWRLAVVMAHTVHALGGIKGAAHLWYEVCQELRFRWDKGIPIPGVAPGFPDSKTCLFNQKLQMLNCCIDRKNARTNAALANADNPSDESEDDEFFDCAMEEDVNNEDQEEEERPRPKHSLWNRPVGRHCRYGNLRLITTDEYLYIPITQEATPKTEDQLEEDAEVLLQLGSDGQGSKLRSRMMSASLLSDMESFKAANPGAILEDFIRWYSPRDWIEDNEPDELGKVKGTLSARMQIPGNTWLEMWAAAKPVPARRQKRLFDDTREAEKVLHQLDAKQPSSAALMLLGPLMHAILLRLVQQALPVELPGLEPALKHMASKAEVLSRAQSTDISKYKEICGEVTCAEAMVAQVASLEHKLCPGEGQTAEMREFLAALVTQPEAVVRGGPHSDIGKRIRVMFAEAFKVDQMIFAADENSTDERETIFIRGVPTIYPVATEREFILRVNSRRPTPFSLVVPHRVTVRLRKDEITMAGCFSQDTTFQ